MTYDEKWMGGIIVAILVSFLAGMLGDFFRSDIQHREWYVVWQLRKQFKRRR